MKISRSIAVISMAIISLLALGGISLAQVPSGGTAGQLPVVMPQEVFTIQRTAAVALRRLAQARADIRRKALAQARHELEESANLTTTIRDNLSTAMARNLIEVTLRHLEYKSAHETLNDLAAIYTSLDAIDTSIPTEAARRHLDRARGHLEKDEKQAAEQELILADRSLVTMDVELPLLNVDQYIFKARESLEREDVKQADEALNLAEQQLQNLFAGVAAPLSLAKTNFWLAFRSYSAARLSDARNYLDLAKVYLQRAAKTANKKEGNNLEKLSREMSGLEGKLNVRDTGAEMLLRSIWERSKALAERSAEYLAASWQEAETALAGDNDLIEARLHVAYAETYQLTAREPSKAVEELGMAHSRLVKAMHDPLAGTADKAKMKKLDTDILSLKELPENRDVTVSDRYESIKNRLSDLLRSMYLGGLVRKM